MKNISSFFRDKKKERLSKISENWKIYKRGKEYDIQVGEKENNFYRGAIIKMIE